MVAMVWFSIALSICLVYYFFLVPILMHPMVCLFSLLTH